MVNVKKIGILNIDDYKKANYYHKIAMRDALLLMDSVVLVADSKSLDSLEYNKIRNELLLAGVCAENKMLFSNNPDSLMKNIEADHKNTLISYYFIHDKIPPFNHLKVRSIQADIDKSKYSYGKEMLSESPLVSKNDLVMVKAALERTLDFYMQEKSVQKDGSDVVLKERAGFFAKRRSSSSSQAISKRIACIEQFMTQINNNVSKDTASKFTYVSLIDSLNRLEYDLSKNTFRAPKSAKEVKKVITQIDNPTKRLVM